jgi:putative acetyltransferase
MTALAKKPSHFITIESFRPEYAQDISELILSIQQREFGIAITLDDQPDLKNIPSVYLQGAGHFWMALEDGKLIGTIALIDAGNNIGVIRKMFVRKQHRGSGIAQDLLNLLVSHARTHGFKSLYLGTIDRLEAAIRFYDRNGFALIPNDQLPDEVERIRMKVYTKHYRKRL